MKKKISVFLIAALLLTLLVGCTAPITPTEAPTDVPTEEPTPVPTPTPTPVPMEQHSLQQNQADEYAYMWFRNGTLSDNREMYVKTGNYGFGYDPDTYSFTKFGLSSGTYDGDLTAGTAAIDAMSAASGKMTIYRDGEAHNALLTTDTYTGGSHNMSIITMGQVCQSFYVDQIPYDNLNNLVARTEINSFCDYFTVYWDVVSSKELDALTCEYEFNTGDTSLTEAKWYNDDPTTGILTLSSADGKTSVSFVSPLFDSESPRHTLTMVSPGVVKVKSNAFTSPARTSASAQATKRTYAVGLIVIPGESSPAQAARFIQPEKVEFYVHAFAPYSKNLTPSYDGRTGQYKIALRTNNFKSDVLATNLEQVTLSVTNKLGSAQRINLLLEHTAGASVAVVGSVPMLRDTDGTPTGIPVQVTKNWHTSATPHLYDGSWQKFMLRLSLPADETPVENEFTVAYQTWGKVPTASHAQLCLIGWSDREALQWEEAAVAAYTECICYAPDIWGEAFANDIRGVLLAKSGTLNTLGGFTSNVGGADFMLYTTSKGDRICRKNIKTEYVAHGPNLAVVKYHGVTTDEAVEFTYTVKIQRSSDLARIYHSFDYTFLKSVENAKTFSCYSYGTECYNESGFKTLAYGNAEGLIKEFTNAELLQGTAGTYEYVYVTEQLPMTGENQWISFNGTRKEVTSGFGQYDRALVIRDWDATIGGQKVETPFLHIRTANAHHQGTKLKTNIAEITAGTNSFSAGDHISGTVEIMVLAQNATDYMGNDSQYIAALEQYAGTWQMAHYEATSNDVTVIDITGATLVEEDTAVLQCNYNTNEIYFSVKGGASYVPVTITNLGTNRGWDLQEMNSKGDWISLSRTQSVAGNDYWQCRYDAVSGTYVLTYNVYRLGSTESTQYRLIQK